MSIVPSLLVAATVVSGSVLRPVPASSTHSSSGQGVMIVTDLDGGGLFSIDLATGDRTIVSSDSVGSGPAFVTPRGVVIEPDGSIVIVDFGAAQVLRVDPTTGDRTVLSSSSVGSGPVFNAPADAVLRGDGMLVISQEHVNGLFLVDPVNGNRTAYSGATMGTGPAIVGVNDVILDTAGDVIALDNGADTILHIAPVTGNRTLISSATMGSGPGFPGSIGAIAVEGNGDIVIGSTSIDALLRVDPANGNRTLFSDAGNGSGPVVMDPFCVVVGSSGELYALDSATPRLIEVDPSTGDRVTVSGASIGSGPNLVFPRDMGLVLPPVPTFGATPVSGAAPLAVTFDDQTTGLASTWSWDFGDGGSSSVQNPTHSYTKAGTYSVTLTVTGLGGCDAITQTDLVVVSDETDPVITCPDPVQVECEAPTGSVVLFSVVATDDCDPSPAIVCTPPSGSLFPPGVTRVTCTATDASGNSASCSFDVTVVDSVPPVVTCPDDLDVECTSPAGATVSFSASAVDVCDPAPALVFTPASGSLFPPGETLVTCDATDASGNSSSCMFTVTVQDTLAPSVTCPTDITRAGASGTIVEFVVTASDVCDPNPTLECVPPSGSVFPLGSTTVTCTATDAAGNEGQCSFDVTIEAPVAVPALEPLVLALLTAAIAAFGAKRLRD